MIQSSVEDSTEVTLCKGERVDCGVGSCSNRLRRVTCESGL